MGFFFCVVVLLRVIFLLENMLLLKRVKICEEEKISLVNVLEVLNFLGRMYDRVCRIDLIFVIVFGLCNINF